MSLQDKTEAPTQRRRDDAREEGRVAKSMDVNSAVVLITCLVVLRVAGPFMVQGFMSVMRQTFGHLDVQVLQVDKVPELMNGYMLKIVMLSLPIMLGAGAVGFAANVMQVGMKIATKSIAPDFSRIDPLKGLPRLMSKQSLAELVKSVLKVGLVGYVVFAFLRTEYPAMTRLAGLSPGAIGSAIAGMCWGLLIRACTAMLVIGLLDYIYQKLHFESTLKMSKQEVKEEYKRSEGDPLIKGKIRQRQQEMAKRRMMGDVPKSDVIITNPTRIAVAIKYDSENMGAPIVLAKGQRLMAQRIRAIAEASGIPIVENKPIARLLYKVVEVGQPIPEELYQAVAEILAFVYRMGQNAKRRYGTAGA